MKFTKLIILIVIMNSFIQGGCKDHKTSLSVYELTNQTSNIYEGGVSRKSALTVISKVLEYSEENIAIEELTTPELWKNSKQQIFRISIDYAWVDSIAIFQNKELLHVLNGQDITKIVIADLNSDDIYEICMTSNFGSGIVRSILKVYETQDKKEYEYSSTANSDEIIIKDIIIDPNFEKNEVELYLKDWSLEKVEIISVDNDESVYEIEIEKLQNEVDAKGVLLGRLRIENSELVILPY